MNIEQFFEVASPYVDTTVCFIILAIIAFVATKVLKFLPKFQKSVALSKDAIGEAVQQSLPEKMSVEIMPLVNSQLQKINEQVQEATKVLAEKMTKKQDAMIKAIASMRNLSNEQRNFLLSVLDEDNKAEAQVVELQYNVSKDIAALAEGTATFEPTID